MWFGDVWVAMLFFQGNLNTRSNCYLSFYVFSNHLKIVTADIRYVDKNGEPNPNHRRPCIMHFRRVSEGGHAQGDAGGARVHMGRFVSVDISGRSPRRTQSCVH